MRFLILLTPANQVIVLMQVNVTAKILGWNVEEKGVRLKNKIEEVVNGNATVLRIITPLFTVVLSILCTLILANVNSVKEEVKDLTLHFTNHLSHHQELEVGYERRISKIEARLDKE